MSHHALYIYIYIYIYICIYIYISSLRLFRPPLTQTQKGTGSNTTPHSSIPALPTLDLSGEQSTPFFIVNLHLHSLAPFHRLPLLIPFAHSSRTKSHPFVSHYSLF